MNTYLALNLETFVTRKTKSTKLPHVRSERAVVRLFRNPLFYWPATVLYVCMIGLLVLVYGGQ